MRHVICALYKFLPLPLLLKTIEKFKSPAYNALTAKNLVFWKGGCLEEVITHGHLTVMYDGREL